MILNKIGLEIHGIPVCMRRNHGFGIWNYVTEQFDESSSGLFFFSIGKLKKCVGVNKKNADKTNISDIVR